MTPNRKNVRRNWQIFLVLVFVLYTVGWNYSTVTAAGTTYYVDNTNLSCSDAGSGTTTALPFCTIGKGAAVAIAGDTVRVLAGTYAETVNGPRSGSAGLPITYSAVPGVVVTGNGSGINGGAFRISSKSYIVVDGFTATGTVDYGIYVWGSNNITVTNNHISYAGSPVSGSTRAGIYINSTTNSMISGNTSEHNSSHGILLTNGSSNNLVSNNIAFGNAEQWQRNANGINLTGSTNNTVLQNITYANEDSGLNIYTGSTGNLLIGNLTYGNGDHGIDNYNSPNNVLVGNTVQGNVTVGVNFEGTAAPGSGGATVMNNIMVDNGLLRQVGGGTASGQSGNLRFDANSLSNDTLDYNIYYLNSGTVQIRWGVTSYTTLAAFQGAVAGQETHGLQANPLFSAPAPIAQRPAGAPYNVAVNVGNYHIQAGSPAIDSANSAAPSEPTSDIEGNPRADDPSTANTGAGTRTYDDRGAYEFQPAAALPTVTTQSVSNIAQTTATGNGTLTDLGVPNPTAYGVVWGTALNPTTTDSVSDLGAASATGAFTASMTGLTPGTLYHVRAFATNTAGTAYGADVTFTTTALLLVPVVTTQAVSAIGGTTATGNSTITDLGVPTPTAYGVVWSTTLNPTTADNVSDLGAASATGAFTAPITGLTPGTLYHVRAFATNTAGTAYGADVTFTTTLTPTVTTQAVTNITQTTATGNGTLTDLGIPNPTAYGVVWSTALNPTTADSVSDLGAASATGAFTAPIAGLTPGTLYHVRAFATNASGTAYGADVTFTAFSAPNVTTQAVTAIGGTTATGNGTITDLGAPNPTAYGVVWNTAGSPTTADNVSDLGAASTTGAFTAPIAGLTPGTLYHVRAFATNAVGTIYGADVTFTTALTPTVTTQAVTGIGGTTATGNGTITDLGVPKPTAYGVVWNTTGSPTTADNFTNEGAASATGVFTSSMTGLPQNVLIYVRAYATNTSGTAYGNEVTFKIDTIAPTVTTDLKVSYTPTGPGSFIATFSKAMDDPAGNTATDDVTNPANYLLVNKGRNGTSDTLSCAGGVTGDDTPVTVTSVIYNSTAFQATITLVNPLSAGSYRLFICGTTSIVDLAGNPLNGGTDYTFDFIVKAAQQESGNNGGNKHSNSLLPATGFAQNKVTTLPIQPAEKAYAPTDLSLEIPSLGVKMSIVGVPSTTDGWDVSWLDKNAGWLNGSAFPTWSGNSVLSGHVWDALNRPGPFAQLKTLKYGDRVKIHAFGMVYTYEVTETSLITNADVKTAFKHEDKPVITLLTCESYQEVSNTYAYRRMVRAVLVSIVKEK